MVNSCVQLLCAAYCTFLLYIYLFLTNKQKKLYANNLVCEEDQVSAGNQNPSNRGEMFQDTQLSHSPSV